MPTSVTMPALGESVTEGTVTRWLKQEGEQVEADEPLLEVSTDKVDTEIPSPAAGVLTKILVAEDETVEVGAELAVIGGDGGGGGGGGADEESEEGSAEDADTSQTPDQQVEDADPEPQQEQEAPQEEPASADSGSDAGSGGGGEGTPVTMPALGESVTEGTVTRWLKSVGDEVAADEPLLEVSTDKVDTEIPPRSAARCWRSRSTRTRPSMSELSWP
ncbi:biotin/lipoyl-containing protein [Blastococcus brunescens]|uniref:Biotin/lipoyl-containing protein n=1 Tax=Blastococcus brunescens TaxID=1564165 RepID=A0ABZ1B588_9ACTN|nr:biotin/lipoyl-containing protein [Blastococcus sp. BMG 8361]WRL65964.1 biotin/lipoyl-containing protein [Blastococcus sp. BMG 8361]